MKPKLLLYCISLLFISFVGLLSSCGDIIEPSIAKSNVQLEAPTNQYQSTSYTLNFWWDVVDNALTYHLQVVSGSFTSPGSLALDTVIKKKNTFSFTLTPGHYQWRVMAANGSSQTVYSESRSFDVLPSSIKQQTVVLNSPANNFTTNQSAALFQWSSLYGATNYRIEIDTNNFINESAVIINNLIPGQQFNFTFPKDRVYQWRVRAENATDQSLWSAVNSVTYDHTPPPIVTLISPTNAQTVSLPINLQWNTSSSAVKYKLYVYKSDGVTLYNSSFPMQLTTNSYSFNLGTTGNKFYWIVTALDGVGNESAASELRNFVLQ